MNNIKYSDDVDSSHFLHDACESPQIINCNDIVNALDEERWTKVVKISLQIFAEHFILDPRQGSEYDSVTKTTT